MLRAVEPKANVHVFGYDSPEPIKHRLFADWLRAHGADRELYARAKQEAAKASRGLGEGVMAYNARKRTGGSRDLSPGLYRDRSFVWLSARSEP